jgi:alpha-beta hydrolase superfamily lysophospholipase
MVELADARFDIDYDGADFTIELSPGIHLRGQLWEPSSEPQFVYLYSHGLGAFLTFKKDFFYVILEYHGIVIGCDHLGHGRSPGVRTALTVDDMIGHTIKLTEFASHRYPNLPIFFHGHSMGGLAIISTIITQYSNIMKFNLKGVIAEAPWIAECPQRTVNSLERFGLATLTTFFLGSVRISSGVNVFSNDLHPTWLRLCKETPLYSHSITPKLLRSVEVSQKYIQEHPELWPIDIPMIFLQGTNDSLVNSIVAGEWAGAVRDRPDAKVTYRSYRNAPHVLLKSQWRGEVARDMLKFIDDILNTQV